MNRFQLYKKVPSGFMHISSVLSNSISDAIEEFKNSQSNTKHMSHKEFLKNYYVGGLLKPRLAK